MKRSTSGFTLIEMLVTVAIIALLAAVSTGAYSVVINHSKQAKCAGNMRAIDLALQAFAGDHKAQFPQTGLVVPLGGVDANTQKPSWMEQIDPYDGANHQLFICPSAPFVSVNDYYLSAWAPFYENHEAYPTPAEHELQVKDPTSMILLGDCTFGNAGFSDADPDDAGQANLPFQHAPWHGKFYNMLFVDGHIESVQGFDSTRMTNRYEGRGYAYNSSSSTPD
jgi:prepilin-type N-terminal cleavage/methylation domain-containing protein/prepilin-type processing-associated H-X9-DG protein